MSLSLICVNVEWSKHLDTVIPFLKAHPVDVVCIQELVEKDIPVFEAVCGPCIGYAPNGLKEIDGGIHSFGNGIFSRKEAKIRIEYYAGSAEVIRLDNGVSDVDVHSLVIAEIASEGEPYRIATTHFTWTPNGEANEIQRKHFVSLSEKLASLQEFVLCGDFNAPRGREMFTAFAEQYTDNIPAEYETSLDPVLHTKAGRPLPYMVDGLFTTPTYKATDVRLEFGISDHAAIIATIEKAA